MAILRGNSTGFLTRLARDTRGNAIALVAAGLIPLLGLIGGGVDMSRIYLTKSRLQQACDAGALAGRKQMAGGSWTANSNKANGVAIKMFEANFQNGAYGTGTVTKSFTESSGKVTGTASVPVPMTIMKIFDQTTKTITVACDAEMRIPNTDVMFVLDTTGSMADCADGSDCDSNASSKIVGLKKAVKCFYEALAKINTTADCGSTPGGSNSPLVQLRFGFMPYAMNVNVGKLLPNSYIADNWTYQSREVTTIPYYITGYGAESAKINGVTTTTSPATPTNWQNRSSDLTVGSTTYPASYNNVTLSTCNGKTVPPSSDATNSTTTTLSGQTTPTYPATTRTNSYSTVVSKTRTSYRYYTTVTGSTKGTCRLQYGTSDFASTTPATATQTASWSNFAWSYKPKQWNVSTLKAGGSTWNGSVTLPIGTSGANRSVTWDGCIEERPTVKQTSYEPLQDAVTAGAKDLNIDLVPSSGDATTQWGPMLRNAIFARRVVDDWSQLDGSERATPENYYNTVSYSCPVQAKKLQVWATATPFETYVNSLSASGTTYHDIGILWGARFMSPTGIFASENAFTASGGTIQRHMIFMSDGDTNAGYTDYTAYGFPALDRRTTSTTPASNVNIDDSLDEQVNNRYSALCTAIKNKNITLWVISYGVDLTSTTQTRMAACASPGKFFAASDTATLISNFQQIANNISALRLTR